MLIILLEGMRTAMRIIKYLSIVLLVAIIASACSRTGVYELEPIGIGKDPSELKKSPCACIKLENGTRFGVSDFS
jgi:hypothetical protein